MSQVHRFFEHGEVRVTESDPASRQVAISIKIPAVLAQTVTPALLGAGVLDRYAVSSPLAAWVPSLSGDRILPELEARSPGFAGRMNALVQERVKALLEAFVLLGDGLVDRSDLVPMLPLGVYVDMRLRCSVDRMALAILSLEGDPTVGVQEFRFAMAGAMAGALTGFGAAG